MESRKKMTTDDVHGREARSRNLLVHARVVVDVHGVEADPMRRSARRGMLHGVGALKMCTAVLPPTPTGNREESGREREAEAEGEGEIQMGSRVERGFLGEGKIRRRGGAVRGGGWSSPAPCSLSVREKKRGWCKVTTPV